MYELLKLKEKKEQLEALLLKKAKIFVENKIDDEIEGSVFYLINKINFINFCITKAEQIIIGGDK